MSNMLKWAIEELRLAGYDAYDAEEGPNRWMSENVIELLTTFSNQGHSGVSAPTAVALFEKLAMWKPITPLTGEDDEWHEVSNGTQQNRRNSSVFKDADQAYWIEGQIFWEWFSSPDVDGGNPYKLYFTSRDSRVNITFPWTQPEKPEYKFSPSTEFPFEDLNQN